MIPGLPRGRLTLAVVLMGAVLLFMAGGVIGGNQAAAGEPLPREMPAIGEPVGDAVESEVRAELADEYPSAVVTTFLGVIRPFLTLVDWGVAIGYTSVLQIGERATRLWMGGVVAGAYLVATVMIARFTRDAVEVLQR